MRNVLIVICTLLAVAIVVTEMARRREPTLRHDKRHLPPKGGCRA